MKPFTNTERSPVPNPAVISREGLNNYLILVNCDSGASLSLNKTGQMVWNLITKGYNAAEIISAIRERYSSVPDSVNDEVTDLISVLAEGGFVGYEIEG